MYSKVNSIFKRFRDDDIQFTFLPHCLEKIYLKIDEHFVYNVECLSSPLSLFLCSEMITPFLNSMISTNQEKELEF